jgi:putative resolvase
MGNTLTARQAADRMNVTIKTIQRWEREGRLIPAGRTPTNRRGCTTRQIANFRGLRLTGGQEATRIAAYCRVSSAAQKADLKNQRWALEDFCVALGLANVEFIEEIRFEEKS